MGLFDYILLGFSALLAVIYFFTGSKKHIWGKVAGFIAIALAVFFAQKLCVVVAKTSIYTKALELLKNNEKVTYYLFLALSGIAIFVVSYLICKLVFFLFRKLLGENKNLIDRIVHLVCGIGETIVILEVLFIIAIFISQWVPSITTFFENNINFSDDKFSFAKLLYQYAEKILGLIKS